MPLKNDFMIAFKDGVAELTTTVIEPHRDTPDAFAASVNELLFEHQYRVMTDPTILDAEGIGAASCLVCRDPLPESLKAPLLSLGFAPVATDTGGADDPPALSRMHRGRHAKLDKWMTRYLRASEISPLLGEIESILIEEVPEGRLQEIHEPACRSLVDAERTIARVLMAPSTESLVTFERQFQAERGRVRGRMVLHPAAVTALAAFVAVTIMVLAPETRWDDDDGEGPCRLLVGRRGNVIETDPELRAVRFIARGNQELLSAYVESLLAQRAGL